MKQKIIKIAKDLEQGAITENEARIILLSLFDVMESDCEHEWLNHSFDHFGFLQEQICDKCGAKQYVQ